MLIETSERLTKALAYAHKMHAGQHRLGGMPYITHPIAVAEDLQMRGADEDTVITALFHDLLEDTNASDNEILDLGGQKVLEAVRLLTKPENYQMDDYLGAISQNSMAKAVKCADRLHNLKCCHEATVAFQRKYWMESKKWYVPFFEGTCFEDDFTQIMDQLVESI